MNVTIKAYGSFRDITGKEMELDLPENANVEDAIRVLCKRYKEFRKDFTDETLLVLNDRVVLRSRGGIEPTPLKDGDVLGIFPPVSGG
jgi:sulfur-carrier protein